MKIVGQRIVLRDDPRTTDADDFYRWCNLEEWNYYDEPDRPFQAISREQFDLWRSQPHQAAPGCQNLQIDSLQGRHLGWVNCYRVGERVDAIFVGIDLPAPDCWGQGYGTEALSLWIAHLFARLSVQAVHLKTWTGNQRMRRVAVKCGLRELSRSPHRAELSVRGEPLEFVEYALSRSEWETASSARSQPM